MGCCGMKNKQQRQVQSEIMFYNKDMKALTTKDEKQLLDQAMALLIKVQLGNGNKKVEGKLDIITEDLSEVISENYEE